MPLFYLASQIEVTNHLAMWCFFLNLSYSFHSICDKMVYQLLLYGFKLHLNKLLFLPL